MKLRNPRLIRVVAILAATLIKAWMATVRYRIVNHDSTEHPTDADHSRFIYACWHESLLAPVKFRTRARVLISQHADGELVARVVQRLGFDVVRGSTTRGGGGALVELWDCSRASHLVFTPDGPRGPRRKVQPGMVMLASKSGLPMLPAGIGYSGAWRARSWDRLAIPKPFSRIVFVLGESVRVPQEIDRSGINHYRRIVETRMLEATEEAERLAAGTNRASKPHFGFARARARREGTPAGPERPGDGDRPDPSPQGA